MMKIDDWEYHIRMLKDIADRNGGVFIGYYDPQPDRLHDNVYKAAAGYGSSLVSALCGLIDLIADGGHIKSSELVDMINIMIKGREGKP